MVWLQHHGALPDFLALHPYVITPIVSSLFPDYSSPRHSPPSPSLADSRDANLAVNSANWASGCSWGHSSNTVRLLPSSSFFLRTYN